MQATEAALGMDPPIGKTLIRLNQLPDSVNRW